MHSPKLLLMLLLLGASVAHAGMVGHWRFDDGVGSTTARDYTGNGHTGTLSGMNTSTDWVSGRRYGALRFTNTANTRVTISDGATLQVTNPLSLAAWVHPMATNHSDPQVYSRNGGYGMTISGLTALKCYFWGDDHIVAFSFSNDVWYHVGCTYDGTNKRFYVNGSLIGTQASTAPGSAGTSPRIGHLTNDSVDDFNGLIDDMRVYNHALAEAEMRRLYTRSRPR